MYKRTVVVLGLVIMTLGALSVMTPATQTYARPDCVICPQIGIECGPCYNLIPQTCQRCQYCKRIPGCNP